MEQFVYSKELHFHTCQNSQIARSRMELLNGGKGEIPLQVPKLPYLCHHPIQKESHRRHKVGQGV